MNIASKIKNVILKVFVAIIPKSIYQSIINQMAFALKNEFKDPKEFGFLNYEKHKIYISKGIRETYAEKEPDTVNWIENYIKPNQVLYDIGANIGGYSLIAAKYHSNNVKIYAFEPSIMNFMHLVKNVIKNQCDNIYPLNIPLSEKQNLGKFYYSNLAEGCSDNQFQIIEKPQTINNASVFVELKLSTSIDILIEQYKILIPNHIKLDVDGNEYDILLGAENTLKSINVKSVLVEIPDNNQYMKSIFDLLERSGFKFHEKYKVDKIIFNYLFLRLN